jgi:hypothetical protein
MKSQGRSPGIEDLPRMTATELQAVHQEMFGAAHPISNCQHLRRKIAWHMQAAKEGGLPDSARKYALAIAQQTALRVRIADNVARRKRGVPLDRTVTAQVAPIQNVRVPIAGSQPFGRNISDSFCLTPLALECLRNIPNIPHVVCAVTVSPFRKHAAWGARQTGDG